MSGKLCDPLAELAVHAQPILFYGDWYFSYYGFLIISLSANYGEFFLSSSCRNAGLKMTFLLHSPSGRNDTPPPRVKLGTINLFVPYLSMGRHGGKLLCHLSLDLKALGSNLYED